MNPAKWRRLKRSGIAAVAAVILLVVLYTGFVRPWHTNWGATPDEITRSFAGDNIVRSPHEVTTRAITIKAHPRHVWPWLAQMGNGRGGLYSYDKLDKLFGVLDGPSSDTLISRFQQLNAGDTIPVGSTGGWPVAIAEPNEVLLLDIRQQRAHVTWVFVLDSISPLETRLIMRVRARLPGNWRLPFLIAVLDPAEFVMVRRQLIGIKQRAEHLAQQDSSYRSLLQNNAVETH